MEDKKRAEILNELCVFILSECVDGFTILESEYDYQRIWVDKLKEREPLKICFISHREWKEEYDTATKHLELLKTTASRKRELIQKFTKKLGGFYGNIH